MGLRKKVQKAGAAVKDKVIEVRAAVDQRDDGVTKVVDGAEKAGKKIGQTLTQSTKWLVTKGAERMGSDKYREELDAALQEALRVIAVQEERIAVLEKLVEQRDTAG